jgi:hypothetical protein
MVALIRASNSMYGSSMAFIREFWAQQLKRALFAGQ